MSWLQRFSAAIRPKRGGDKDKPPPSERGWTDSEISKIENDRFGFSDYAEVLAGRARTAVPPLTIGLYGSWGSGKTSLMRLMEQELKGIEAIWINVWQLSNQDEVWQAFLQALFNRVNSKLRWWQRIEWGKLLRSLAVNSYRVVVVITPLILGAFISNPEATWRDVLSLLSLRLSASTGQTAAVAGTVTSYALALWLVVKPAIEAAREVVNIDVKSLLKYSNFEVQISELMQLQKRFAGMVNDLVGKDGRLVVFIDDLDRCTPGKIPELLEAIKLFTTTPKCVYVLGLDYDIVREGISHRYSFIEEDATDYLEKIVQIPFHLPPLDESKIRDFVIEDYPEISQRCPTSAEVFSKGLEPNPRKVKRALNIYRTVLELAEKRVYAWEMDPVNDELVAKMVVIQSRFRVLHEHLVRQPHLLIEIEERACEEEKAPSPVKDRLQKSIPALFGKPGEESLFKDIEIEAMVDLLKAGQHGFASPDQREQVSSYIYLIATAEGGARGIRPSRRDREILLGGDKEKIAARIEEIKRSSREDIYIQRLRGAIEDHTRYLPSDILSANIALDMLEDWTREGFEPQTVRVPAGKFLMGSSAEVMAAIGSDKEQEVWMNAEQPQHEVSLSEYRIGRYPVTNKEYLAFVQESGRAPLTWGEDHAPVGSDHYPVTGVIWEDMIAYCKWLTRKTGRCYRLPTEAQWEKASRGADGRIYPWGNDWDPGKCNNEAAGFEEPTPVDRYSPGGDSPYGAADMVGNVWEWCIDWFMRGVYTESADRVVRDPQVIGTKENAILDKPGRVLRGGALDLDSRYCRCAARIGMDPVWVNLATLSGFLYTEYRRSTIRIDPGFRVVFSPIKVPDWQREEIEEWEQLPAEFKPVELDDSLANARMYPDTPMPFTHPVFGEEKVPFELNVEGDQKLLKGIETPASRTLSSTAASVEIPGSALIARGAFVLIAAGNARRQIGDIKLEGMKIGFLEFHFEGGETFQVDLVLGENLRDWSYKHPEVIGTLSDHRVQQVWRDPKDKATMDMLRINFPYPPREVERCWVVPELASLSGVPDDVLLPTIRISGLTYQIDLDPLLSGDDEKIKVQVEQIREWGAEQECISHLTALLADPEIRSRREVISANTALDLLEGWRAQGFEPQTVRIPAGYFLMGSDPEKDHEAFQNEQPQHQVYHPDYRIGRYPVTNAEYNFFMAETGHPPPTHWLRWEDIVDANFLPSKGDHPVVNVSWQDALAYCEWLSQKTCRNYRLPSEAEWEKAARGIHGRRFPWGNAWEEEKLNALESNIGGTTPVGHFSPAGDSPFGVSDMAGNVWEWTRSILSGYPYDAKDGREDIQTDAAVLRVMRGGAFHKEHQLARCAFRGNQTPSYRVGHLGFRVVISQTGD